MRYNGPVSFWPSKCSAGGEKNQATPGHVPRPSTGREPTPYLPDFTEGLCGLPYLFQSSSWKVCIQTDCLWKGDLQREGGLWHCFTGPVKQSEGFRRGGTLFSWGQKDRSCLPWQTITWFHDCTAGTKGLELKRFQGKGILTRTFYSLAQF